MLVKPQEGENIEEAGLRESKNISLNAFFIFIKS
jgi:hypothetical protein